MVLLVGLMSGTSLDGVDGVLADFSRTAGAPDAAWLPRGLGHAHAAMPAALRAELLALNRAGADELHRAAMAANALVEVHADVVQRLLRQAGVDAAQVAAIGAHGQTVRHQPQQQQHGGCGYTLQLMNGALLAERTGIDVVCDFRSRDVAAGGQGAPLAPAFHAACFSTPGRHTAVLNLGGIANLTLLRPEAGALGFDCGPANVLMDAWCQRHRGAGFDADGGWAAGGCVDTALLAALLAEPYFALPPPKSTGRDLFDAGWLAAHLAGSSAPAQDVMATLAELTARTVADALLRHAPRTQQVLVCGGGARNAHVLQRLRVVLGGAVGVDSTATRGVPPDQVEALAFAWLAWRFLDRLPGNLPAVTGADGPRVLGALYPA